MDEMVGVVQCGCGGVMLCGWGGNLEAACEVGLLFN